MHVLESVDSSMKPTLKLLCWIFGAVAVVFVAGYAHWATNPLRKGAREIRAGLLQKTPLESSVHEVEAVVSHEHLKENGHWNQRYKGLWGKNAEIMSPWGEEVAVVGLEPTEIIRVDLGSYWGFPRATLVEAFWEFDSNGKLIGLNIQKLKGAL